MKWIIFLFLLGIFNCKHGQPQESVSRSIKCKILEQLFQEKSFYEIPSLNLSYIDTITILDKSRYFGDCEVNTIYVDTLEILNQPRFYEGELITSIYNKTLVVKRKDLIPFPLDSGLEEYGEEYKRKYRCYFLIEKPQHEGNLVTIKFYKLLSNHSGYFIYKITNNELELVKHQIGQY